MSFKNEVENHYIDFTAKIAQLDTVIAIQEISKSIIEELGFYNVSVTISSLLQTWRHKKQELINIGKTFENTTYEKVFIDLYSYFELFINQILTSIYTHFKGFLLDEEKDIATEKKGLEFKKMLSIQNFSELEALINNYIELKVTGIIQRNTMFGTLIKFINNFPPKPEKRTIEAQTEERLQDYANVMYFVSVRNSLIHNNGWTSNITRMVLNSVYTITSDNKENKRKISINKGILALDTAVDVDVVPILPNAFNAAKDLYQKIALDIKNGLISEGVIQALTSASNSKMQS